MGDLLRYFWLENESLGSLGVEEGKKIFFAPVEYSTASRSHGEHTPRAEAHTPKHEKYSKFWMFWMLKWGTC